MAARALTFLSSCVLILKCCHSQTPPAPTPNQITVPAIIKPMIASYDNGLLPPTVPGYGSFPLAPPPPLAPIVIDGGCGSGNSWFSLLLLIFALRNNRNGGCGCGGCGCGGCGGGCGCGGCSGGYGGYGGYGCYGGYGSNCYDGYGGGCYDNGYYGDYPYENIVPVQYGPAYSPIYGPGPACGGGGYANNAPVAEITVTELVEEKVTDGHCQSKIHSYPGKEPNIVRLVIVSE